jgi:hypothetical protein
MERKPLEQTIFTYEKWDEGVEPGDLQMLNVTLAAQVGEFPTGTKFPYAYLGYSGSFLALVDDQKQQHVFDLTLRVGQKLTLADFPERVAIP